MVLRPSHLWTLCAAAVVAVAVPPSRSAAAPSAGERLGWTRSATAGEAVEAPDLPVRHAWAAPRVAVELEESSIGGEVDDGAGLPAVARLPILVRITLQIARSGSISGRATITAPARERAPPAS